MATAIVAAPRSLPRRQAALAGLAAGLLPDADVFLRNAADPLFFLEYHRHFTHSVAFSPVIALLASAIAWTLYRLLARKNIPFLLLLLPAWVATLSHIYCDVWTSYGTRVWWPFLDSRVTTDWVAVVDLFLTVPLVVGTLWALRKASWQGAAAALLWVSMYLGAAAFQNARAEKAVSAWMAKNQLAAPDRLTVKPSISNILVWRALVMHGDEIRIMAVRCGLGQPAIIAGKTTFSPQRIYPTAESAIASAQIPSTSRQARDIRRFFHFSDHWVGTHPDAPLVLGDLRYAALPNDLRPLWGIRTKPGEPDGVVDWLQFTEITDKSLSEFWNMLRGTGTNP
jgi:inner membrane protein